VDKSSNVQCTNQIKVWDFPTRFFHWSLVLGVALCWLSIDMRWLTVHKYTGMYILFLLIFRIIWGVVGAKTARFTDFVTWPSHALTYLKSSLASNKQDSTSDNIPGIKLDKNEYHTGHNPAGGWMVIAMILLLLSQVISGLLANDDIGFSGPLADLVTKENSDWATQIHSILFDGILLLIWLHIVAVFFYYLVKLQNLIRAMITGCKPIKQAGNSERLFFVSAKRAAIGVTISVTLTILIFNWPLIATLFN
jgi:cytochrome b